MSTKNLIGSRIVAISTNIIVLFGLPKRNKATVLDTNNDKKIAASIANNL
ncbi:hypothetical protein ABIB62_003181 [Mucilaginibacter sp. UYP25]